MATTSPTSRFSLIRLPNELLVYIITLACGYGPGRYYIDTPYRSVRNILNLAHTCALFRQIIKNTSKAARPLIMQDLPLLDEASWVDAAAGSSTLPIIMRADIPDPNANAHAMDTLIRALSFISRVEAMILRGREGSRDFYPPFTSYTFTRDPNRLAPVLKTLRISNMDANSLFWSRGLLPELPSLQIMQLRKCNLGTDNPLLRCTTLTVLVLERVTLFAYVFASDLSTKGSLASLLRSCSATLRELILYDEHLFGRSQPVVDVFRKHEPHPSKIIHLPALEKISLRAHSSALGHLITYLDMPNLLVAHIVPVMGYTPFDRNHIFDHILPVVSQSLLRGANTYDCVLLDHTLNAEFARLVAKHDTRVLEISFLNNTVAGNRQYNKFEWDISSLCLVLPDCIHHTPVVHLVAEKEADTPQCRFVLEHIFPKVITLALHGMCAINMVQALVANKRPGMAPFLARMSISGSNPGTPYWWHKEIAQALGSAEDIRVEMKRRDVEVKYDSVMAPLVGNVPGVDLDDETKKERRRLSNLVRGDWEELAHSLVAVLDGYGISKLRGEGDSQALLE